MVYGVHLKGAFDMELVVNNQDRPGRNEPCHCGSGQKYKKCCLNEDEKRASAIKNLDPVATRFEMEKMMGQIGRIMDSKNLSVEDMNKYFVGRTMDEIDDEYDSIESASPKEEAQELLYQARELSPGVKRLRLVKKALEIYPHLPDAYDILVEETASSPEEALILYEKAVQAGEADLGPEFIKENEGYFWGAIETRPYMRAKVYLAQVLWDLGREDEAISHYKDCLRLNPNDNQGVRDPLLAHLLIKNDLSGAEEIIKKYKNDAGAAHQYNKALFLFKKYGAESKKAAKQLSVAIEDNPFVPQYLIGKLKTPKEIPSSYSMGSKDEAVIYVSESLRAWKESSGALRWLVS